MQSWGPGRQAPPRWTGQGEGSLELGGPQTGARQAPQASMTRRETVPEKSNKARKSEGNQGVERFPDASILTKINDTQRFFSWLDSDATQIGTALV